MNPILQFFILDTIKIFLLLITVVFAVAVLRTFLPKKRIRAILAGRNEFLGNVLAAMFGVITPFCSCSAVPLFIGFLEAGIPLGVTFSFLVASPMINEVAAILLLSLFGWKIATLYISSGLLIAIISGIIIGRMRVEKLVANFVWEKHLNPEFEQPNIAWEKRLRYAAKYTLSLVKKIAPYIVVGVGLGAFIHGYVPSELIAHYAGTGRWYAVPLAVIIGIPLYSNAAGVVPLIEALVAKGVGIGTALALMMSVTALSFPEFAILKKVMKTKLIVIFATIVGLGIIFTGDLLNALL